MQLAERTQPRTPSARSRSRARWETPVLVHSRVIAGDQPITTASERLVWLSPRTVKVIEDDARDFGDDARLEVTIVHAAPKADVERVRHYLDHFADLGVPVRVRRGMLRCA